MLSTCQEQEISPAGPEKKINTSLVHQWLSSEDKEILDKNTLSRGI